MKRGKKFLRNLKRSKVCLNTINFFLGYYMPANHYRPLKPNEQRMPGNRRRRKKHVSKRKPKKRKTKSELLPRG